MNTKRLIRNSLGDRRVRRIKSLRTRASAHLNLGPWRRPGLQGLDKILADAIGWAEGGTFIELGANDGLQASNTFLLEQELSWRGILIEPIPQLAAEAQRNRPRSTVICAAASSSNQCNIVSMAYEDLTSRVNPVGGGGVSVATTTLSTVIGCVANGQAPDLLSVDVEGHELDVLAGLDLSRHRPRWILVESDKPEQVAKVLPGYSLTAQLSYHDYLFTNES